MNNNFKRLKYACYTINLSMSVVGNMPPLLFIIFRNEYGLSFSFLGFLVLLNFLTQLGVDLVFSFFSHKFSMPKTVKSMPYITFAGLFVYSVFPLFIKSYAHIGLMLGTIIFSASAGLAEVLISPIIASLPSDDPDREMSRLHSVYAWGVVPVILLTTLLLKIFGNENWQYIVFFFMLLPVVSVILFSGVDVPDISSPQRVSGVIEFLKDKTVWLFVFAIFFCGAAECTMAQWASGYIEKALGIKKIYGDIFGVTLFSVMLGIGRTLYGKKGKNIIAVLTYGSLGAFICYLFCALCPWRLGGLIACVLTGFFTSMLWPGCLVVSSERFLSSGVLIYALMAAGGDMGAAIVPQLVGLITDGIIKNNGLAFIANKGILIEEIAMKSGILIASVFPLAAFFSFLKIKKLRKSK